MNILFFSIRLLLGFAMAGIAIGFFIKKDTGAAFVMLLTALTVLLVLLPVVWKMQKPLKSIPSIKATLNSTALLSGFRFILGLLLCWCAAGAALTSHYHYVIPMLLIGLILLSPLDAIVFAQPNKAGHQNDEQEIKSIRTLRDLGILVYVIAAGFFFEEYYVLGSITLLTGLGFLLLRPLRFHYKQIKNPLIPIPLAINAIAPEQSSSAVSLWQPAKLPVEKPTAKKWDELKKSYAQLARLEPQRRGYAFQDFLNTLFSFEQLSAKTAFRLTGEEIDGSFELDGQTYLVEAKWLAKQIGQSDLLVFNGKVEGKSTWARGIFISNSGFTSQGLEAFARGKRTSIIGMDDADISLILEGKISLSDAIRKKVRRAGETNAFFVPLQKLIEK